MQQVSKSLTTDVVLPRKIGRVLVRSRRFRSSHCDQPLVFFIAGLKYYTSKLATFDDLSTVRSFGFRGEALSSLCALCDSMSVTTTTSGPMGIQLDLEHSGNVGKRTKVARQVRSGRVALPHSEH